MKPHGLLAGAILLVALGCQGKTLRLDLRDLDRPVLLTPDPFVEGRPEHLEERQVDEYRGEVRFHGAAADGTSRITDVNDAQAAAFEKLVGYPRAITDAEIDVSAWGKNGILAVEVTLDILVKGIVREYTRR